jgi:hypothetical protein
MRLEPANRVDCDRQRLVNVQVAVVRGLRRLRPPAVRRSPNGPLERSAADADEAAAATQKF